MASPVIAFFSFWIQKNLSDIPSNSRTLDNVVVHFIPRIISMEIGLFFLYALFCQAAFRDACVLQTISKKPLKDKLSVSRFA